MMETLKGDVLIHNHPGAERTRNCSGFRGRYFPGVAAGQSEDRFLYHRQPVPYREHHFPSEARVYLKPEEIAGIFEEGGLLSKNIPQFEPRAEQVELVNGVTDSVNGSKILISEAGTGTGKSLA